MTEILAQPLPDSSKNNTPVEGTPVKNANPGYRIALGFGWVS